MYIVGVAFSSVVGQGFSSLLCVEARSEAMHARREGVSTRLGK